MKKTLIIAMFILNINLIAQTDSTKKFGSYASIGISVTNSNDFKTTSYPSIEGGVMYKNLSIGAIIGRGSLYQIGKSDDNIKNYFYEIKATGSYPIGILNINGILGYGGYFNTPHNFIEYGLGLSFSKGKMGYGVTYSNWDGSNYLTPSITLNF